MNDSLRRAIDALESGLADVRAMSAGPAGQLRARLNKALAEAESHLERSATEEPAEEDLMSRLDRQSRDIAEDLRRADELMKRRTGRQ